MFSTERGVILAARARMAARYPGANDVSDDPHEVPPAKCPAFAVALHPTDTEVIAMGRAGRKVTALLEVAIFATAGAKADLEGLLYDFAQEVAASIMGPPDDLGASVFHITHSDTRVEVAKGRERVGRLDLSFEVVFFEDGAARNAPPPGGFSAGFSLGFKGARP